jgi:hypothetical protein
MAACQPDDSNNDTDRRLALAHKYLDDAFKMRRGNAAAFGEIAIRLKVKRGEIDQVEVENLVTIR